jgi:hypothetical protein
MTRNWSGPVRTGLGAVQSGFLMHGTLVDQPNTEYSVAQCLCYIWPSCQEQTLKQILSIRSVFVQYLALVSRTNIETNTEHSVAQCLCNIWPLCQEQTLRQILSVQSLSVCAIFGPHVKNKH